MGAKMLARVEETTAASVIEAVVGVKVKSKGAGRMAAVAPALGAAAAVAVAHGVVRRRLRALQRLLSLTTIVWSLTRRNQL